MKSYVYFSLHAGIYHNKQKLLRYLIIKFLRSPSKFETPFVITNFITSTITTSCPSIKTLQTQCLVKQCNSYDSYAIHTSKYILYFADWKTKACTRTRLHKQRSISLRTRVTHVIRYSIHQYTYIESVARSNANATSKTIMITSSKVALIQRCRGSRETWKHRSVTISVVFLQAVWPRFSVWQKHIVTKNIPGYFIQQLAKLRNSTKISLRIYLINFPVPETNALRIFIIKYSHTTEAIIYCIKYNGHFYHIIENI